MDNEDSGPSDPKFLHIPYDKRWNYLKETIIRLYTEEEEKLERLVERMKAEYSFDAQPSAYKYRFKKWDVKKSISSHVKTQVIKVQSKRKRDDASTSDITIIQGGRHKPLDKKRLKRWIDDSLRQRRLPELAGGVFLRWNLPYKALVANTIQPGDPSSPLGLLSSSSSPVNIMVNSPENSSITPTQTFGPSPTTQLVRKQARLDRTDLFIQGRHQDLLLKLDQDERKVVASWLHDFWIHSFMTAKYWGRGPQSWTPGLIAARTFGTVELESRQLLASEHLSPDVSASTIEPPSQLCRWSIHYSDNMTYDAIPSPPPEDHGEQDIEDESTWTQWNNSDSYCTSADIMRSAFASENSFSRILEDELPLSTSSIVAAVGRSQDEIEAESWAFAIMARNLDALDMAEPPEGLQHLYPFHLAAAYLDGAGKCCLILNQLIEEVDECLPLAQNYRNNLGHTVLDSLMISILRSHTSITPGEVCEDFQNHNRFPGEEVDICGRWDADSRCIRQLYASGKPSVPIEWKHAYCHTSVQAVCHSIIALFARDLSPDIDIHSGLFSKRCHCCGLDLKLLPLHTLVLVAFYLSDRGTPNETLFGAIATLNCMLALGADLEMTANISAPALLGTDTGERCTHRSVTPSEFALLVPDGIIESWPHERRFGWRTFVAVLNYASSQLDSDAESDGLDIGSWNRRRQEMKRRVGVLWASCQTEFLTYRRLETSDPWLSERFDMRQLKDGIDAGLGPTNVPLYKGGLMSEFTGGGWFDDSANVFIPTAQEMLLSILKRHQMLVPGAVPGSRAASLTLESPRKLRSCDYDNALDEPYHRKRNAPLMERSPCGLDLSIQGQSELLQCIAECTTNQSRGAPRLWELAHQILAESGIIMPNLLDSFAETIHKWLPIVDLDRLRQETESASETWAGSSTPALILAIRLITLQPCSHRDHAGNTRFYNTMKLVTAAAQPDMVLVQAKAILALYECSHGLSQQAYLTLSSTVAMASFLGCSEQDPEAWLKYGIALITLDRVIFLSAVDIFLEPLMCPETSIICKRVQAQLIPRTSPVFPNLEPTTRKLQLMGQTAMASGRALQYVCFSRKGYGAAADYYSIETELYQVVQDLLTRNENHPWFHCDAITMATASLLALHQERVRQTGWLPGTKDSMALQTSQRISWDTCKVAVDTVVRVDVAKLSLIGLLCILRAAVDIAIGPNRELDEEIAKELPSTLRRFGERWAVGGQFMAQIESVLRGEEKISPAFNRGAADTSHQGFGANHSLL
ncbi:hypothetical protein NM208_g7137 [Fusarium decemcellulare]|uniref:Uncharacterized protein n=1 Tax=Fusarium decemcellulare TaxID=57161 RepID=A0ACC1SAB9_9HYPO|nr:hypothetical protein NM208_g7137 [Fusarium decemcellulare]